MEPGLSRRPLLGAMPLLSEVLGSRSLWRPLASAAWNLLDGAGKRAHWKPWAQPKLNFMEQEQDEKDDEYQPDKSRRTVTPSAAMRPPGKCADENQNENDNENSRQHFRPP